ncbi:acyl-CoA dehydrogenase family protein [Jiangella endophytica]|uniref:acyl-CoA dehydrogenase family protein n=1 Tax=Jiangella endophytica TaxID=1623398 RepID=UPI000E34D2A2|nr:acyl-CoA dehydrogenase family protein [Jiangella endophytica]
MSSHDFTVRGEIRELAQVVGEFVQKEIRPREQALPPDARCLPDQDVADLQKLARSAGFWNLAAPTALGGGGLGAFDMAIVDEQAAKHTFSFPIVGNGAFGYPPPSILYGGSKKQIEEYVVPTLEEGWRSFTAITEQGSGSDPARSIRTTAVRKGGAYVLNGQKMWITHADKARYGVVYARTDVNKGRDGISAFIVDKDTPGLTVRPIPVIRDLWTNEVSFDDVEIPAERLIGEEGQGFAIAQNFLGKFRVHFAVTAIGVGEESVRLASEFVKNRESFGLPFAQRQGVQFALADAHVKLKAARWLTWEAAKKHDSGANARIESSIAKLYATEACFEVVDSMMQLMGGMGLAKEMPLEHWFRDLRVARVVEGPSDIHRFVLARELLGSAALPSKS